MTLVKNIFNFLIREVRAIVHSIRSSYKAAPQELQKGTLRILGGALTLVLVFIGCILL